MASFLPSFKITAKHEGKYVDDPVDTGGETYMGVSRRFHPSWPGWGIVDSIKPDFDFRKSRTEFKKLNAALSQSAELQEHVQNLYKQIYWDRFRGDRIKSQKIANELFDTGVNMGVRRAVRFLQESLNLLNRNERNYDDLVEDGSIGNKTINALDEHLDLENNDTSILCKLMNILQGMHYVETMKKSPTQERYARGWLNRVSITR